MSKTNIFQIKAALVVGMISVLNIFSGAAQAATSTELSVGLKFYTEGRFAPALAYLNDAVAKEPGNAQAHYYFANALAQTNQHQRAIDEYRSCLALNPSPTIAAYCLQALKAYSGSTSRSAQSVHSSIDRIRSQAKSVSTQILNQGSNQGTRVLNDGSTRASTIINQANADMKNMNGAIDGGDNVSFYGDPLYVANSMAAAGQIKADAQAAALFAKQDATRRMVEVRTAARMQSHSLNDSALGLITQMTHNTSGPRIDASKSSLYTRTYTYTR